jgi:hypothetical protein
VLNGLSAAVSVCELASHRAAQHFSIRPKGAILDLRTPGTSGIIHLLDFFFQGLNLFFFIAPELNTSLLLCPFDSIQPLFELAGTSVETLHLSLVRALLPLHLLLSNVDR